MEASLNAWLLHRMLGYFARGPGGLPTCLIALPGITDMAAILST